MTNSRLDIISEQKSPLFRIMWVTNPDDLSRRHFDNNISAFHIGNGLVVSVAHNLRVENSLLKSVDGEIFENEIIPLLNPAQQTLFNQCYTIDMQTKKRHINITNAGFVKGITEAFASINFDRRWVSLTERNITVPYLIIQFSGNSFYGNHKLTKMFNDTGYFFEPSLNRHTFLLKLKLEKAFYGSDLAVYKIVDTPEAIIQNLPFVSVDYSILKDDLEGLYCLQSSPAGFLGRLLNQAQIEGYLDQYQVFKDKIGGDYVLEGYRYLIKGYFRFGSSGAPYLVHDEETQTFKVNAVQSEASPIQLSINNNREGNFQYVNAIASPLKLIQKELEELRIS